MKILIVDDNQDNRTTIELLLEEFEDIQTSQAHDGNEAIEACKKESFDIIFMDIMMPNVDGITATKVIKSFDKKVMILALSALDDETSKNEMLASGAEDYITKPIEDRLFHQRFKNYQKIVRFRMSAPLNVDAVNLFNTDVYSRSLKFAITSEHSLAQLWDYYLNTPQTIYKLSDCIRIIYALGQLLLKAKYEFAVVAEDNDENLYLTLSPVSLFSELVIQHTLVNNYPEAIFILKKDTLSFRLPKAKPISKVEIEKIDLNDYQKKILSKTHFNKTTALEYVENTAITLMNKIEDLEEIENRLEAAAIAFEQDASTQNLHAISALLGHYVSVIVDLMEFEHFAYALSTLNSFFESLDVEALNEKEHKTLAVLFMHLLDDITQWRKTIFILKEANDIHYLDSSLLSSCLQIQSVFEKKEIALEDDDEMFELF